ncbi:C2 family cysteine protease [Tumebacillus avium]|nr:C2 family cysteine protease [Tumebacillus avium]
MRTTVPKGPGPRSQARPTTSAQFQSAAGMPSQQQLLQMQQNAGNRKTVQYLQSQMTIQRSPDTWTTWPAVQDAAAKGTWGRICALAAAYSKLLPAAAEKRESILLELDAQITKWQTEYTAIGGNAKQDVSDLWMHRAAAINDLVRRMGAEWKEMDAPGTLLPSLPEERVANPELSKKKDVGGQSVEGGFFSTNERILDEMGNTIGVAKKGYLCEFEKPAAGPSGLKAGDYYKVRPSAEMAGSKNYLAFREGYVVRTAVSDFNLLKKDGELGYEKPNPDALYQPLFPHAPKLDDVKQGYIGDCYLLAAVLALVNKSPGLISGMMRDNGNGTVTVKMFDVEGKNGKKTFTPREVTIEKSVVKRTSGKDKTDENAQGTLWVQLLEKAYAAAGYYGRGEERVPLKENTFEQLASGIAGIAFEHLTGHEAVYKSVETYQSEAKDGSWLMMSALKSQLTPDQQMELFADPDLADGIKKLHEQQKHVYPVEIDVYLQKKGLSKPTRDIIRKHLEAGNLYSGKRGTGKYTKTQLDTFAAIQQAVDAKHPMAISSHDKIASPKKGIFGVGHSGGEQMAKGLVGRHVYAVLDYRDNGGLKEVKVRNPWGNYGRTYGKKFFSGAVEAKEVKGGNGEFWLELSDLTKRFHTLHSVNMP